jgi:hypothetical protein
VADPGERSNLIGQAPERAEALRRQLFDWLAAAEKFESEAPTPAIDGSLRREMQGLGDLD